MELLEPAQTLIDAAKKETFENKVKLVAHLLRALSYLHLRGIIHRDLKPSNVLCSGSTVKVVDFGLAVTRRFEGEEVAGTLSYIAPELFHGAAPSVKSDLYAVGVIIRQIFAGDVAEMPTMALLSPAQKQSSSGALTGTTSGFPRLGAQPQPASPDTLASAPGRLYDIAGRLLAPDPKNRYASALEVLRDLNRALGHSLPVETTVTRESFFQTPELVGRDRELELLSGALESAAQGRGSTWLVTGESGIGKSRLLSEVRTLALVQGGGVSVGQAVTERGRSFQVWLPVLRTLCLRADLPDHDASVLKPLVPELPSLLGRPIPDAIGLNPNDARKRLFESVERLLRIQDRLTVILLEDLQWADVDSVQLLNHLSGLTASMRLLVVGSYRHDEAPDLPVRVPGAALMRLHPLDKDDCSRLASSMAETLGGDPELMDYLFRESEGNVFFLIEIIRELANRAGRLEWIGQVMRPEHIITGGIARVVRRRLENVPPGDRKLLVLAAITGRNIDFAVLRALAPDVDTERWLWRSVNAGILERRAEDWRFSHDKIREAILADIPPDERASSHLQVAGAIENAYSGPALESRCAVLAYHCERGGDLARASRYFLQAGDLATRLCAYGEARQHYAAALQAAEKIPNDDANRRVQIDALLKLAYTRFVSDSADENFSRMTKARALLDGIGSGKPLLPEDQVRLARIESAIGRIHFYRGDAEQALAHYARVLPVAKASGDAELLALPACLIGTALLTQGRLREAEPLLAEAIAPLEHLGEPFEWFRAAGYYGSTLIGMGRYKEGVLRLETVLERAMHISQPSILSAAYLMRGSSFLLSGDWQLVIDNLTEVINLANQTGDRLHASLAWSGIGWARSHLGSLNAARICRNNGLEIARELGGRLLLADWYEAADAEMALHAGDFDLALRLAEQVGGRSRASSRLFSLGIAERVRGEVQARYFRFDQADEHMKNSIAVLEEGGLILQAAWSRARWGAQLRDREQHEKGVALLEAAYRQFESSGCEGPLNELRRLKNQYA